MLIYLIIFSTDYSKAKNYLVENIEIIEPYDVNFKKKTVIDKAFISAFDLLIFKIVNSNDLKDAKSINLNNIKYMIDSFSISDESFIENNYSAKINVLFEKKKVLKYLYNKNITPSIPIKKKIIFFPIFINLENSELSIYSENKFFSNWNVENKSIYLLNYILPNEDLEEFNIIKKNINNIENYDFGKLLSKYDKDFIVAIFFKNKNNLKVLSKINLNNKLTTINNEYSIFNTEDINSINKIIEELKTKYDNFWKKENIINFAIKLPLTVLINSSDKKLINKFEQALKKTDLIYEYSIDSMSNKETIYKIIYNSTPDKFIRDFESKDFKIDYSKEVWRIK